MGNSAEAILCFGVVLDSDTYFDHDDGDPEEGPAWMLSEGKTVDGIKILRTTSYDEACYVVAIADTVQEADWEHPRRLKTLTDSPATRAQWTQKLKAFVVEWELATAKPKGDKRDDPGWLLAAFYG